MIRLYLLLVSADYKKYESNSAQVLGRVVETGVRSRILTHDYCECEIKCDPLFALSSEDTCEGPFTAGLGQVIAGGE